MELVHHLDAVPPPNSLTPRQQEFCIQFVLSNSKAKAARLAGYASRNSSSVGCRLLKRSDIQGYIAELRSESQQRREVPTVETLAGEYAEAESQTVVSLAAYFDLTDGVIRLRDPDDLAEGCLADLENIEFDPDGRVTAYRLKRDKVLPSLQRMLQLAGQNAA